MKTTVSIGDCFLVRPVYFNERRDDSARIPGTVESISGKGRFAVLVLPGGIRECFPLEELEMCPRGKRV